MLYQVKKTRTDGTVTYFGPRHSNFFNTRGGATQSINRFKRWSTLDKYEIVGIETKVVELPPAKCRTCGQVVPC